MNSTQFSKLLDYAAACIDSAYLLFPKAKRTAAAADLVAQIAAARRVIAARAMSDFEAALATGNMTAANEARAMAARAAVLGQPTNADPSADTSAAIKAIETACAALAAMPQAE